MTPRFAVVGTGAIGGLYGAKLAAAGCSVSFLARSDGQALREHGLRVDSVDGDIVVDHVDVEEDPERIGPVDVVLVTIKTTGNSALAALLPPLVRPGTIVVLMQNGFGAEDTVAQIVPEAAVLGGLCFVCATRLAPGHIVHSDYGMVTLAEHTPDGSPAGETAAVRELADVFEAAGIRVSPRDDLLAARWQKLVWNMPYNGLSVLLDAGTDELMADHGSRRLVEIMMAEVASIADAHGHAVGDGFVAKMLANTEKMKPYATSMKLDFEAGRPLELQSVYDAPLAVAAGLEVPVPKLSMLAAQLHFLDRRNRGADAEERPDD